MAEAGKADSVQLAAGSKETSPPRSSERGPTDIGAFEATIALVGIVAVVFLAGFAMWFYGSGGETSAVAVLGASLGTIGSIVGAIVGVGMGTKSGSAAGAAATRAADANTRLAKSAAKRAQAALTSVRAEHAARMATAVPTPDALTGHIDNALQQVNQALDDLR